MIYLTSRSWDVPEPHDGQRFWVGDCWFFNLWRKREWPFRELKDNDVLYIYDKNLEAVRWEVSTSQVQTYEYTSLMDAGNRLDGRLPSPVDRAQPYFSKAPSTGFLLAFEVRPRRILNIPRPPGLKLPRLGWIKGPDVNLWI